MLCDRNSLFNTADNCWVLHPAHQPNSGKPQYFSYGPWEWFWNSKSALSLPAIRNKNYFQESFRLKIHSVTSQRKHQTGVTTSEIWDDKRKSCCVWQHIKIFQSELLSALCGPGLAHTCSSQAKTDRNSLLAKPCREEHPLNFVVWQCLAETNSLSPVLALDYIGIYSKMR